jgi:hypothetical protein
VDTLTYKIALKRKAIDDMDTLELRALAYFAKRLFKDLRFPWKRITMADLSMSIGDGPQMKVKVPGIRFGALFAMRERPTQLCVNDSQCLCPLFLLREIPHEHAGPLLPAAVCVYG